MRLFNIITLLHTYRIAECTVQKEIRSSKLEEWKIGENMYTNNKLRMSIDFAKTSSKEHNSNRQRFCCYSIRTLPLLRSNGAQRTQNRFKTHHNTPLHTLTLTLTHTHTPTPTPTPTPIHSQPIDLRFVYCWLPIENGCRLI